MIGLLHGLADWLPLGLPAYLFLITVVVFFHELGHFSVARACGIKVETFSIGFGPAIFGWTDGHGTRWKVSWIPFGGYVKFLGDADAASVPDRSAISNMSPSDRENAFPFKPLYQRAMVVAAGPIANFILAVVIFSVMLFLFGRVVAPPVIGSVYPGSAAQAAGIQPGDIVRSVNGETITDFDQLPAIISLSAGHDLAITLERQGRLVTVHATPRVMKVTDALGESTKTLALGISSDISPVIDQVATHSPASHAGLEPGDVVQSVGKTAVTGFAQFADLVSDKAGRRVAVTVLRHGSTRTVSLVPTGEARSIISGNSERFAVAGMLSAPHPKIIVQQYGLWGALEGGAAQTWMIGKGTLVYIGQMVTGQADMSQLHGPVGVAGVAEKVAALGFLALVQLAALMSVSIGLINLFPIPLLDGGHLLYYGCEAVLGRPLGERAQDVGFRLGLAVVLGLMILATWNDLVRLNLF